jgi:malate dehydrogenase (oxaloacetate-decarboxylating)(NADP+)
VTLNAHDSGLAGGFHLAYTACAGVPPARCLPVTLDVGTDTKSVREDQFYLGRRAPRLAGEAYAAFVEEFIVAVQREFPDAIVQFEDFNNASAFSLLGRYRDRLRCFNDDIQSSGAMVLAGLYTAGRLLRRPLGEERLLFVGAGEAGLGIGLAVVAALQRTGLSAEETRSHCFFIDSHGTVVAARTDLPAHKRAFAQHRAAHANLVSAIDDFRPTALIGACGCGGIFTQPVLEAMVRNCESPVVFALSNPTSKAECTAEQAYAWTNGRVVFATGSPFEPVKVAGAIRAPGQANNSYIFPGIGLGVMVSGASRVIDAMFLAAADALAEQVSDEDLAVGRIFPPQTKLRDVAVAVAAAVARAAFERGVATKAQPNDLTGDIRRAMYQPQDR